MVCLIIWLFCWFFFLVYFGFLSLCGNWNMALYYLCFKCHLWWDRQKKSHTFDFSTLKAQACGSIEWVPGYHGYTEKLCLGKTMMFFKKKKNQSPPERKVQWPRECRAVDRRETAEKEGRWLQSTKGIKTTETGDWRCDGKDCKSESGEVPIYPKWGTLGSTGDPVSKY